MRRRLLVLVAVFAAAYLVGLVTGFPMTVAVIATIAVGFGWIVAHDVRRTSWAESRRRQDAVYGAAAIAALHGPGQSGADCPSGFDGGPGGADCGAGGV
jgi:hypothetical protein